MVSIVSIFDEEKNKGFNRLCHLKCPEFIRLYIQEKKKKKMKKNTNDNKVQFCRNFLSAFPFRLFQSFFIGWVIVIRPVQVFFFFLEKKVIFTFIILPFSTSLVFFPLLLLWGFLKIFLIYAFDKFHRTR